MLWATNLNQRTSQALAVHPDGEYRSHQQASGIRVDPVVELIRSILPRKPRGQLHLDWQLAAFVQGVAPA
jgi:hypothetical protein